MKQQSLLKQYHFPLSFSLQLATLTVCVDQASGCRRNRTGSRQLARLRHSISRQVPFFHDLTVGTAIALEPPESDLGEPMLKISRAGNGEVMFTLVGRMDSENVAEMKRLFASENGRRIVLDLKDLMLVDRDAVKFLEKCEADRIKLKNCPTYIREWIRRERASSEGS
jgi:hypothetical protein